MEEKQVQADDYRTKEFAYEAKHGDPGQEFCARKVQ